MKAEHTYWNYLLWGIFTVFVAFAFYSYGSIEWPVTFSVTLIVFWAALSFENMQYTIKQDRVVARLWPLWMTAKKEDITDISLTRVPWYAGVGMHFIFKTAYFTSRYGQAVLIERKGIDLVITPKNPEEVAKELRKKFLK